MTTLAPLLTSDPVVQIHAGSALLAMALGPVALLRQRRDRWHRLAGRVWVALMLVTALSSFWINDMALIGPFGPIHALSILTLVMLARGVAAARARRLVEHQRTMQALYVWSLGVAGLFTLLPGRTMHRVVFGQDTLAGFLTLAALFGLGAGALWWRSRKGPGRAAFPLHISRGTR